MNKNVQKKKRATSETTDHKYTMMLFSSVPTLAAARPQRLAPRPKAGLRCQAAATSQSDASERTCVTFGRRESVQLAIASSLALASPATAAGGAQTKAVIFYRIYCIVFIVL